VKVLSLKKKITFSTSLSKGIEASKFAEGLEIVSVILSSVVVFDSWKTLGFNSSEGISFGASI
jgi:hypothetical protein